MSPTVLDIRFAQYACCYLFSTLCGWTMHHMLTQSFLQGLLPQASIIMAVMMASFIGFLFLLRWLVWEEPDWMHYQPVTRQGSPINFKPKKIDLTKPQ